MRAWLFDLGRNHAQEEGSAEARGILTEAARTLDLLERQLREWELERLLGGPYDRGGAVLSIQVRGGSASGVPPVTHRILPIHVRSVWSFRAGILQLSGFVHLQQLQGRKCARL